MKVALLALTIGLICDWQRIFPAIGDRIAAVCALVAVNGLVVETFIGDWLRSLGGWLAQLVGDLFAKGDPAMGTAIAESFLGLVALLVTALWLLAMIPNSKLTTRFVGRGVTREMSSGLIWGGALVVGLFVSAIPGALGEFGRAVTGFIGDLGTDALNGQAS